MVFKELEIQGFKSFPDKVKITFDEGVTGVVGPNGSGKSNLSDAVRWVLGETSARQLRAAGKMEDVIFGGTRRRGAMGFAQVRLTLDNSSHALDVEADEVTIGRRYYRSGESEYSINGQICRLKDVYELLLDTGIGRDGYSVIGQGRIAEIVAAKSSERREIFEEACGIAKYRYRKNEAERRLAAAAENLERLRDILGELEARVGPLEKESEKARKFLELSARRKTLEVTLWTDGVHRAKEAVRRQVRDYETAQADYERFDRQTKAAESEAEEIRMQAQQLTIAVERLNGDIRSITEQISGSESRIAVLENDIARNEESAEELRAELAAGQQDSTEAAAALERHRAVAASMEAAGQQLAAELAALNKALDRLTHDNDRSGARKDSLRTEITALTARRTEAQVARAAAEASAETAKSRLPALEEAAGALTAQRDDAKQDLADTVKYRAMLVENETQLANVRAGLELKYKARRTALDAADDDEQKLSRALDAARQRLSVLRELEKNMDGYQNSVKAVMRAAGARRLRGVIGPVSAILTVEPGCEVAVETALGGALQNIVVENEAAAKAAIAAEYVDVLQIPAFLCRQTDLLIAAAQTGKTVNIKKGQFLSPEAMKFAAQKVIDAGNNKVAITERGTTFGYHDLIVDSRGIPEMQTFGYPVILDVTHSLQQPNQTSGVTGGMPQLIETIAKAGIAVGADGLFIETHENPAVAKSDGANMLKLDLLEGLLTRLVRIREAIK